LRQELTIGGESVTLSIHVCPSWKHCTARHELFVSYYTQRTQFKQTLIAGKSAQRHGDYRDYDFVKASLQDGLKRIKVLICLRNPY
jgi:hypothetical protein